jgi:tRNA(His) guanylyltransferase
MKSLGDRMKEYEDCYRITLTRRTPVIIRVDGKAFHSLTTKCKKPFDKDFMNAMLYAASQTSLQMQGFKLGYVQSDEASFLLTDFDEINTEPWFGNNLNKIVSISSSYMTAFFNQGWIWVREDKSVGVFDSRAFNVPIEEVANYFLWRARDWERNSLQMYCQAFFSHKELMNKDATAQHEMLHSIGKNWATDLTPREKNGTFIFEDKVIDDFIPNFETIEDFVNNSMISTP